MQKPTYDQIIQHPELYEPFPVAVEAYKEKGTGNILFVTDDLTVLDGYVKVTDQGGIPVVEANVPVARRLRDFVLRSLLVALSPVRGVIKTVLARRLQEAALTNRNLRDSLVDALRNSRIDLFNIVRQVGLKKAHQWLTEALDDAETLKQSDWLKELEKT